VAVAIISFLASFVLVRYKLKEAKIEERLAESVTGSGLVISPTLRKADVEKSGGQDNQSHTMGSRQDSSTQPAIHSCNPRLEQGNIPLKIIRTVINDNDHQSWTFFSPAPYNFTQSLPLAVYTTRCCWFYFRFDGHRLLCLGCTTTQCSCVFFCYDGPMSDFWSRDSHMVEYCKHYTYTNIPWMITSRAKYLLKFSVVVMQKIHISPQKCPSREKQHYHYERLGLFKVTAVEKLVIPRFSNP
jgi:hypothetical protein